MPDIFGFLFGTKSGNQCMDSNEGDINVWEHGSETASDHACVYAAPNSYIRTAISEEVHGKTDSCHNMYMFRH